MIGQPVPTLLRSRIADTVGVGSSSNPVFELIFFNLKLILHYKRRIQHPVPGPKVFNHPLQLQLARYTKKPIYLNSKFFCRQNGTGTGISFINRKYRYPVWYL